MKRILEYSVFDILKDKENVKFLDKIKKENPDLYPKFLNILKNKGLDVAKEKYQIHSPEYKKQQKELDKEEARERRKEKTEEGKEEIRKKIKTEFKSELEKIDELLIDSTLKSIIIKFENSKKISELLRENYCKKYYKKLFSKYDKSPKNLYDRLKSKFLSIELDKLEYIGEYYSYLDYYKIKPISIEQMYSSKQNNSYFNIRLNLKADYEEEYNPYGDVIADALFVNYRNKYINKVVSDNSLSEKELYESIDKLEYALSNEFKEDWKMKNTASKFNL